VLAVSDEVDEGLLAGLRGPPAVELILACGDLPASYLAHLMDALDVPLVFVPGNHDPDLSGYRLSRAGLMMRAGLPARYPFPEGAVNADGRVVDVAGLRVAGLGGCLRYGAGPNQYAERQQARRALRLRCLARWHRLRDGRGVDVLLTHAPPRGLGDGDDPAHRGFACYHGLVAALAPAVLLHGHTSPVGVAAAGRSLGGAVVRNVTGRHLIDLAPLPARSSPAGTIRASAVPGTTRTDAAPTSRARTGTARTGTTRTTGRPHAT
jgi:Calcineurin-like phosphoesterase